MKTIQIQNYQCEICGHVYTNEASARECESEAIRNDKGAKVGDVVIITSGEGKGMKATVESRFVFSMEWGHYAWERYWHTVGLTAKLNDSWGHRQLTFDSYELVKTT